MSAFAILPLNSFFPMKIPTFALSLLLLVVACSNRTEASYCHNDPVNNVDVLGLESVPVYQSQVAEAMTQLGSAPGAHEMNAAAIDAQWAKWMELFAAAEAAGQKGDPRLLNTMRQLCEIYQGSHEMNDLWLDVTMHGAQAQIDVANAGINRIFRQSAFVEWAAGMDSGNLNPSADPEYFDDDNPEFQRDERWRRFIQFNPGGTVARHAVNGQYGAASLEFGKEVAIWSTLGIAGEFVGTGRVVFGVTRGGMGAGASGSLWRSRLPGVQVRQIGSYWVKRVNPNSSSFLQSWGQATIDQQAGALARLRAAGRPAAGSSLTESGRLIVEDVGNPISRWNYLNPKYWSARSADAKALGGMGRLFNDLRPGNYGSGFRAFDPALDPAIGVLGIGGGTAIGGGIIWWSLSEGE